MEEAEGKSDLTSTTCAFFVKRKNRFCKMKPGKGRKYCGEHLNTEGEDEVSNKI